MIWGSRVTTAQGGHGERGWASAKIQASREAGWVQIRASR